MSGTWRKLHKILGLSVGVLLLMICISGGILVFKENLIALNLQNAPQNSSYSINELSSQLRMVVSRHEMDDIFYIKTPTQGRHYWLLVTRDERMHLYDDIKTDPIVDSWNLVPALHWLSHLHTELLIPSLGTTILTLLGIFTLLLMLAGFISWWPGRKGFRWQHLWTTPSRRGPALRQHRAWAMFCIPLLALSVVTGGGMSIQSALRFLFPQTQLSSAIKAKNPDVKAFDVARLDKLLKRAQKELPESEITLIGLPSSQRNELRLRFRTPDEWHVNGKTNVIVDAVTGELRIKGIEGVSTGRKILNTFYPLHSSYGLNATYKALVALTGALTVWLAILGFTAWFKRRAQSR